MESVKWFDLDQDREEWGAFVNTVIKSSCLHRASMIIKHFISQLMRNIKYVDTIKIIKYLKVFQHVSDHRGSIIRERCTVLG